jgi:hypothetical protein
VEDQAVRGAFDVVRPDVLATPADVGDDREGLLLALALFAEAGQAFLQGEHLLGKAPALVAQSVCRVLNMGEFRLAKTHPLSRLLRPLLSGTTLRRP